MYTSILSLSSYHSYVGVCIVSLTCHSRGRQEKSFFILAAVYSFLVCGTEMSAESIASLSPTAAATSKLLKSGMTLTQVTSISIPSAVFLFHFCYASFIPS